MGKLFSKNKGNNTESIPVDAQPEEIPKLRVLMIGDKGVGKTSLLLRFGDGTFEDDATSLGMDCKEKLVSTNNKNYNIELWDTGGQEEFRNITISYYRNANCVLILYDLANRDSYTNINLWKNEHENYTRDNCVCIVVGTKKDLKNERAVSKEEAEEMCNTFGIPYIEISSKTGTNVDDLMDLVVTKIDEVANDRI
eukprot:TRINITY_DN4445_c0_g1_i2.p1 TRINITY_DN4445_c0_g1~~TRINITY_DN4445_c0_g1_i2.p1  ORF type:complete len:196 (+),score=46.51 TRINITY_DN4445_c0_g1_i2:228-815(+)